MFFSFETLVLLYLICKRGIILIPQRIVGTQKKNSGKMGAPGFALTYLLKRMYPLERLAMSTLASESKNGLEQLPLAEINAIKGNYLKWYLYLTNN